MSLAYRPADVGDLLFVTEGWIDSFRTSRSAGLIAMDDWSDIMTRQVRKVLARPGVDAWVAFHPGEKDRIADLYGFIAVERNYDIVRNDFVDGRHVRRMVRTDVPLVHFVYVKKPYRRMGVARGLFKAAGVGPRFNYTCRTSIVTKLAEKIPQATWEHLVARFPKNKPTEKCK